MCGDGMPRTVPPQVEAHVASRRRPGSHRDPALADERYPGVHLDRRIPLCQRLGGEPVGRCPPPGKQACRRHDERAGTDRRDARAACVGSAQGDDDRVRQGGWSGPRSRLRPPYPPRPGRRASGARGCRTRTCVPRRLAADPNAVLVLGDGQVDTPARLAGDRLVEGDHPMGRQDGYGVRGRDNAVVQLLPQPFSASSGKTGSSVGRNLAFLVSPAAHGRGPPTAEGVGSNGEARHGRSSTHLFPRWHAARDRHGAVSRHDAARSGRAAVRSWPVRPHAPVLEGAAPGDDRQRRRGL